MNKLLIVNKPKGFTSRDIVNIMVKKFNTKKVGHAGTLDPLAEGVLIICINKATKLVELLPGNKVYKATGILGTQTDTLDIEGTVLSEKKANISKEKLIDIINSFKGKYNQEIPLYSATKVNGMKLYEYARKNIEVELPSKQVEVYNINLNNYIVKNNKIEFEFICEVSKGTYIRSLIKDIAIKANTVGIMSKLTRLAQGKYKIEGSYTLEDIENDNYTLLDISDIDIEKEIVDDVLEKKIKNGQKLERTIKNDVIMYLNNNKEVLAIYKKDDNEKGFVKPYKMFYQKT